MANSKSNSQAAKSAASKTRSATEPIQQPRRLKTNRKQAHREAKQAAKQRPKLTGAPRLFVRSLKHLWRWRRLFVGIIVVHTLLTLLLVQSLASSIDTNGLLESLRQAMPGQSDVVVSLAFFSNLIGSVGKTTNESAAVYQTIITILTSLALIWSLRQTYAQKPPSITVKQAFYKSTNSLVPFIIVFLLLCLQTIPLLVGATAYAYVNTQVVNTTEAVLWGGLCLLGAVWSLRMLSSSVWSMYIVTLGDMTPLKSWRSARDLARYRRWTIMRKLLFLPFVLVCAAGLLMLPLIIWLPGLAGWFFLILNMVGLAVGHSYLYALYRELLEAAA